MKNTHLSRSRSLGRMGAHQIVSMHEFLFLSAKSRHNWFIGPFSWLKQKRLTFSKSPTIGVSLLPDTRWRRQFPSDFTWWFQTAIQTTKHGLCWSTLGPNPGPCKNNPLFPFAHAQNQLVNTPGTILGSGFVCQRVVGWRSRPKRSNPVLVRVYWWRLHAHPARGKMQLQKFHLISRSNQPCLDQPCVPLKCIISSSIHISSLNVTWWPHRFPYTVQDAVQLVLSQHGMRWCVVRSA